LNDARGTPGYRGPELLADKPMYNKVDIWSMGCILYELAAGQRAFNNDWATHEYKMSTGSWLNVPFDEYFSDQCKAMIGRNIALMLQIDSTLRPSAMHLLEEFSRNFQITHIRSPKNVQIHHDFNETQQSTGILDSLNPSLQGNDQHAFEEVPITSVIDVNSEDALTEPMSTMIIVIEFGTRFTKVAYAHIGSDFTGNDTRKITESVRLINKWPSSSMQYTDKIPTIIAYNTNPPRRGKSVRPNDDLQVSHFILGLEPHVGSRYSSRPLVHTHQSAVTFPDHEHPSLPGKTAVDFAADFLTCVHRYVMEVSLPRDFGNEYLKHQQISYVTINGSLGLVRVCQRPYSPSRSARGHTWP
jgi:serine/threonine protein kinase